MSRADNIYNYNLYSWKVFKTFLKYAIPTAKKLKKEGKVNSWFWTYIDMFWCNIRYGAEDTRDYVWFELYKLSGQERNKFVTRRRYFKYIKSFDKETFYYLIDKPNMYKQYAPFIKRHWLLAGPDIEESTILDFVRKYSRVLIKPSSSEHGLGVDIINSNDTKKIQELLLNCKYSEILIEEVLVNCKELRQISPNSLNTFRINVVNINGNTEIANIILRAGSNGSLIDNFGGGGIAYNIDIKTGIVDRAGRDEFENIYVYHPGTKINMVGFKIPRFEELCEFAKSVAAYNDKVVFPGLDIAMLEDRLEIIEVNYPGGRRALQGSDKVGRYYYALKAIGKNKH